MHQPFVASYFELLNPELAHSSLAEFTVWRVLNYLVRVFKAEAAKVILHHPIAGDLLVSPGELALYFRGQNPLANHVAVTFWGGPPGLQAWHEGSLLSFMVDQLFVAVARGDIETVEIFLRSVAK